MANEETPVTKAVATVERIDNGKPALYNPAAFDQIWRAAKLFSESDLVPTSYKGKPANCFIAIEMADRMGIAPFAMLQSLVIIQGKPSMEAKLITALVNDSGVFVDPLEYEVVGDDPYAADYKVRAFATMKKTGKVCLGPWIDYRMVKGEGWLDKGGSKWKTMPSIMFMYRAASFFAKVYCSNITMGMPTREEMEDVRQPVDVTPAPPLAGLQQIEQTTGVGSQPHPAAVITQRTEVVDGHQTGTAQLAPPARKRGEPSEGRKRRTKEEMAEDAAADLEDQKRAEAAQKAALNQGEGTTMAECPCEHPTSRFDEADGHEYCDSCGVMLDEAQEGDFQFPDLTGQQDAPTGQMIQDTLGVGSQPAKQEPAKPAANVDTNQMADLF